MQQLILKNQLPYILKPGDIILTNEVDSPSWYTPIIKISNFYKVGYGNRGWEHSVLYLGNDRIIEANPEGITESSFSESYLNCYCNFLVLRHRFAKSEDVEKVITVLTNLKGKEYDFGAFIYFIFYSIFPNSLHFLLGRDTDDSCYNVKDAYFCAELIATGLRYANVYCFERAPSKIRPIDFCNELIFEKVALYLEPDKDSKIVYRIKRTLMYVGYIFISIITPILFFIPALLVQLYIKITRKR
jgi:hypothetical protein